MLAERVEGFAFDRLTESFLTCLSCILDGKYLVLPSGELHIRDVGPEDGYKSYQCRTKHRLTGETRLSATKGRLVITGKQSLCFLNIDFFNDRLKSIL